MTLRSPAVALATFYFWYFAFLGAYAPFWPLYLKSVGMSAAEIGALLALVPVTRVFGPAFWGWLADHRGRRSGIVRLTATVTLFVYLGVFAGSSFAWLFAVMLVMNLFWCGSLPLVEATTMAHLGDRLSGYGRIRAWGSVGFVFTVVAGGYLLDLAGVRSLLWLIASLLVMHAVSAYVVPEAPRHAHRDDAAGLAEILRRPEVIALFASCFLMSVAHGPYHTFYSIWLVDHGYSKSLVGWLWAFGVVCEIGVFFFWTRLTARFDPRRLLMLAFGIACARFVLIGWLPGVPLVVVVAQAAHAATFGVFHGAAVSLTHGFFRGRHQAKGQALYSGVGFGAGGAAGGFLSGLLWERIGGQWTFTAGAAAGLAALLITSRWLRAATDSRST